MSSRTTDYNSPCYYCIYNRNCKGQCEMTDEEIEEEERNQDFAQSEKDEQKTDTFLNNNNNN